MKSEINRRTVLVVEGLDCPDEVAEIKQALEPFDEVVLEDANFIAGKVTLSHPDSIAPEALIKAITEAGLPANLESGARRSATKATPARRGRFWSVIGSGALTGIGLIVNWMELMPGAGIRFCFGGAVLTGGWFIFPKALTAVRRLSPDMNLLMTVAVTGAIGIGEWGEAAAVTFLFALSELLESFSVERARRAIQSLLQLAPDTALLKSGDSTREVPVSEVSPGDLILVRSGARIPLDGEVVAGTSAVNQAPITGESMPVEKRPGDGVFAGSINAEGSLEVRVTRDYRNTTLARIIHLVEEAQSSRAPTQRFVDVFARYYTPAVMALALAIFAVPTLTGYGEWLDWLYRALVLLVIACPCALVISTPVSIVSGLTAMARRGVLIKGGAHLESIGRLDAIALDKTGTITAGQPGVCSVEVLQGEEAQLIRIAAGIDGHSDHPLAQAIVRYAREQSIGAADCLEYQSHPGRGAEGMVAGHRYFVGNHRLAHELGVCSTEIEAKLETIEKQALSVVIVGHKPHDGCPGEVLGIIAVGDAIRPEAAPAIARLRAAGVHRILMLSGDNQRTVDAIARSAGIDEARGDLLPEQKIEAIEHLKAQQLQVGMIGDGVNDAPAMAAAHVGIAMGAAGTDTALETADIALMQDDLGKVAEAVHLGRRTVRIIKANIAFSLGLKVVFLALAVAGYASLWMAILADTGATLVVIANSLRLLKVSTPAPAVLKTRPPLNREY